MDTWPLIALDLTAVAPSQRLAAHVRDAERAGLDAVLLDDLPGAPAGVAPDPIETAAHLAAATRRIGLLVGAATTHAEPFHLANRLSSLDWGSRGRAGWLASVDTTPERAAALGVVPRGEDDAVHEAGVVVDAVRRLWDSWEDGALIADVAGGRFLDAARLHRVDAGGDLFRVAGPGLMPRPPQGLVPVLARTDGPLAAAIAPEARAEVVEVDTATVFDAIREPRQAEVLVLRAADVEPVLRELVDRPRRIGTGTLRERLGLARPISRFVEGTPA